MTPAIEATGVLIVEDQLFFAEAIRGALEYLGMPVVAVVSTGEEALACLETSQPEVVLMSRAPGSKRPSSGTDHLGPVA
jgi:CheY-like chemotaxis protein